MEFGKKTLRKFNKEPKTYINFLKMMNQYERTGHQIPDSLSVREIMRRANQCLKANEVIQIEVHHAKSLFDSKEPEQGRNIFENLVTQHPRRYFATYSEPTCGPSTSTRNSNFRTWIRQGTCSNGPWPSASKRSRLSPSSKNTSTSRRPTAPRSQSARSSSAPREWPRTTSSWRRKRRICRN